MPGGSLTRLNLPEPHARVLFTLASTTGGNVFFPERRLELSAHDLGKQNETNPEPSSHESQTHGLASATADAGADSLVPLGEHAEGSSGADSPSEVDSSTARDMEHEMTAE